MTGQFVTPSNTPVVRTGTTLVERGGPTSIGWSPVGNAFWAGGIDELFISARALSEGFLQTMAMNWLSPRDFYGVGEVNSASVTNLSPILPPIFATAAVGQDSIVDAASRAFEGDSGQVKTLEALSGSGGGTSTVSAGRALFRATTNGTWRRTATVKDNANPPKRTLAPIIWSTSVAPPVSGRPKFAPTTGPSRAATPATLASVYAAANAGDQLILASGNYSAVNFNRTFDPSNPVIIRSTSTLGAVFTGTITLAGTGHWLHEIKTQQPNTTGGQVGILLHANNQTITRCWINNAQGIASGSSPRGYIWIGWNRFTGQNTAADARPHIYFSQPNDNVWTTNTSGPHQIYIYRNFFWDPVSTYAEDHSVNFGNTKAGFNDIPMMWEVYIEENFWHAQCARKGTLYLKRGCNILYNHSDTGKGEFGVRHGMASKIWGNRIRNVQQMVSGVWDVAGGHNYPNGGPWPSATAGQFHDIRGNVVINGSYYLFSGCTPSATDFTPQYQAAHYALLVGNVGDQIRVGWKWQNLTNDRMGGAITGVRIYLAGKMTSSQVITSDSDPTHYAVRNAPTISAGAGGFAYPGDGTMRPTASYNLNGSEQGLEVPGQNSAT